MAKWFLAKARCRWPTTTDAAGLPIANELLPDAATAHAAALYSGRRLSPEDHEQLPWWCGEAPSAPTALGVVAPNAIKFHMCRVKEDKAPPRSGMQQSLCNIFASEVSNLYAAAAL